MNNNIEKAAYGSSLTVFALNGTGRISVIQGGVILSTESSENLSLENHINLATEERATAINIRVENADSTSYRVYSFPLEANQSLGASDYIDSEGLHINGSTITFSSEQETAYQELQDITLYEGITHITVTDEIPTILTLLYNSIEEDNQIYVLNKNEQLLAVFNKDDEDTLINPKIEKKQNSEAIFTFTINMESSKWEEIKNPENLYLVDGMMFSTNFDGSFKENISENDEKTVEVTAYERQQLLSRKFVRAWNSETNLEKIDTFMVVILSNGDLPLKNDGTEITTRYPKGSSGYALEGLLYGTGWTVGTCDVYEYEDGQVVKDENDNPVYAKFDLETDQTNIYDNILKVQELWGGILVFDSLNKIVHHRNETVYLPYNGYEVRYQKNMQSLEKKYNNKIITKLCPLGEGGLNIKSVNNNSVWLKNYSYTNTVLEGIENNPDITDPTQLKRWGERKLEMLCRPSIELDVNVALLYQLEGYELETVDLNHIVDVIDYEDVYLDPVNANGVYPKESLYPSDSTYPMNKEKIRLRVVEFSYFVWNKSDATIKLSNITLDSTDIFRKMVIATNTVSTGTIDATKVVTLYKGGQSVESTMFNMDGKVDSNYDTLTDEYDTLSRIVATKVGNNEIILKINNSSEPITINADKLGISSTDVLNLLAGNTINLTSQNIAISSTNFSVDASGNVSMNEASINGGNVYIDKRSTPATPAITVDLTSIQQSVKIYGDKIVVENNVDPTASTSKIIISSSNIKRNGEEYFVSKGVTISDLNNLTDSGFYYVGNTSVSNTPSGFGTWYGIFVIRAFQNGGYTFQLAYKPSAGKFAMREYSGNPANWTTWRIFSA